MKPTQQEIEARLRKTRIADPPLGLGKRATMAAERAWQREVIEWPLPVLRLAACAAGMVVLMSAGNWINGLSLHAWQHSVDRPVAGEEVGLLADVDASVLEGYKEVRRLMRTALPGVKRAGAGLAARHEQIRAMLEEVEPAQPIRPPARQGRSHSGRPETLWQRSC